MFKNLHLKLLAFILATLFWIFIVSLENIFIQFPEEIPIQVFNQGDGLALASKLGGVKLILRSQDSVKIKNLSPADFEAYVDLRNAGVGRARVPVSVTSKNPEISIVKVEPSEIIAELEPVRQKMVVLSLDLNGNPAKGFRVNEAKLSKERVSVSGAESLLKKIVSAKAKISLQGDEKKFFEKPVNIVLSDKEGAVIEGLDIEEEAEALISIVEMESSKQVGVKAVFFGSLENGAVKKIEIEPSVVSVTGEKAVLESLGFLETEKVDINSFTKEPAQKVKLALPDGINLESGEPAEVTVKVEIEKL